MQSAPLPEPQRDDAPAPEPERYGPAPEIAETMEATLKAAFQPETVFKDLRDREASDYFTLLINTMLWAFIGELVFLAAAYVLSPSLSDMGAFPILLGVVGGLIAAVPVSFAAGAILHGLSLLAGAKGGYNRSYQLVSLMGGVLPASAGLVFVPVPFAWLAPTVYASWLAVKGVELLHRCYGTQVLSTVGLAGLAATALQFASHKKIETFQRDLATRATLFATQGAAPDISESPSAARLSGPASSGMALPREGASAAGSAGASPGMEMGRPLNASASPGMEMGETGETPRESGLGMIRRIAGDGEFRQPEPMSYDMGGAPRTRGVADGSSGDGHTESIAQTVLNMLNQQLQKNPDAMRSMSPEQRARFEAMLKRANDFSRKAGAGGVADEQTRKMLQDMTSQLQNTRRDGSKRGSSKRSRPRAAPVIPEPDDNPFASDGQ